MVGWKVMTAREMLGFGDRRERGKKSIEAFAGTGGLDGPPLALEEFWMLEVLRQVCCYSTA